MDNYKDVIWARQLPYNTESEVWEGTKYQFTIPEFVKEYPEYDIEPQWKEAVEAAATRKLLEF